MTGSPYTLDTAREILLGRRSRSIKILDQLLGAGILAAGPVGLATGQPWLLAAWGWMDQKSELIARLDELVGAGRDKLRKAAGRQRHEVLAATHTALTVGAFFAAFREMTGQVHDELLITAEERELLVNGDGLAARDLLTRLLRAEIPLPWAGCGFEANRVGGVRSFYRELAQRCVRFFSGFEAWVRAFGDETGPRPLADQIVDRALDRYRADYFGLASDVPEFQIWALFGEHLAEQNALARLESFTRSLIARKNGPADFGTIADMNRAILTSPIVDLDETANVTAVRVPTVESGYVEPGFRWAVMGRDSRPSSEEWWSQQQQGADLASFLSAHFASPRAAEQPLVVLGHPGSGKSLLTKVCAARLSATGAFTTVRVPLRAVPDPSASVYRQIEDVLRESTHGRVEWSRLCEASQDRVRVVLIDGLDELMQATGATESRYLRNIMDFQRTEAIAGGPVAVLLTSRTVVADLAAVPEGCLVVMLDEFTDGQIDAWSARWAEANAAGVARGEVRQVDAQTLRTYGALARQPLLLLLLAIVAAERDLPPGDNSAALYRMLLDDFIRRELSRPDHQATGLTEEQRRVAELWKLGIVAFGMLNRGQQHLHEQDLASDLRVLPGPLAPTASAPRDVARRLDPARRMVGRFFFVHTSEAGSGEDGRSYEFLHATFADYLIAHHTVELLRDAAAALMRRSVWQPWDDDLLFALLSHTLILGYGSRAADFIRELAAGDEAVAAVLESLIPVAHRRWGRGRHADYDPSGRTAAQRLAAYTANFVVMRLAIADRPVELSRLCPPGDDVLEQWQAQMHLWESMLAGSPRWARLIEFISPAGEGKVSADWVGISSDLEETAAILAGEPARAAKLAMGRVLLSGAGSALKIDHPVVSAAQDLAGWLLSRFLTAAELTWADRFEDIPPGLATLAAVVAAAHGPELSGEAVRFVFDELDGNKRGVGRDALVTLLVQRPDVEPPMIVRSHSRAAAIMMRLVALINAGPFGSDMPGIDDLTDTPEGQALLAMPSALARRLIPEMAASLIARLPAGVHDTHGMPLALVLPHNGAETRPTPDIV